MTGDPAFDLSRPCEWCGILFTRAYKKRNQRFCTKSCGLRARAAADPDGIRESLPLAVAASAVARRSRAKAGTYRHRGRVGEHRLVAAEMLGRELRAGEVVHHINGDPADNRPENLRVYASHADHIRDHGFSGENHPRAVLTQAQADEMRRMHIRGWTSRQLASHFAVGVSTAKRVIRNQSYVQKGPA